MLVLPELTLPGRIGHWLGAALNIAFVLACALGLSRIAVAALTEYAARNPSVRPALGVGRGIVRIAVAVLAAIMALESLGVPVAPLLTTLGIGSLAVALALQDTLANFFAGLHLLADRPVRPGDYIKLIEGAEGFVETIGWRSSRLRTTANNIVVVPNQKLSQAILTNFHLPISNVTMTITLTVAADADADAVDRALNEELARAVAEIADLQETANPSSASPTSRAAGQVWQLHRRRQGRGGAGAGRARGPQAPARPPATRRDRAGGEGKGLPATRKEPAQRLSPAGAGCATRV